MKLSNMEPLLTTANGAIICARCQALSKRTHQQCGKPALKGKKVCQFHGGRSTGAKTEEGRLRIAHSKTQHGNQTRQARAEHSAKSAELSAIEDIMHLTGMTNAPRMRGRKAAGYEPITSFDAALDFVCRHPITP